MLKDELVQKVSELFENCTIMYPSEDEIIVSGGGLPAECSVRDKRTEGISVLFFNSSLGRQQEIKYIYHWPDAYELLYMGLTKPDRLADDDGTNVTALLGRKPYDFKWLPEGDIVDIDDHTLKNLIAVVKHGFVRSLSYQDEKIIVEGYESVYEADLKSQISWRRMVVNLLRKEQHIQSGDVIQNHNCSFDSTAALFPASQTPEDTGPDRISLFGICGFLEYAYRNGDLPRLLEERDRIRKDYRKQNEPYDFTWNASGGLMTIPESVYQLARQIRRAGLVSVGKELNSHNCVTIMAPDFNAAEGEAITDDQEQTLCAMAASVEEWSTKAGKKEHKDEPYKAHLIPIGDQLFESDKRAASVYESVYFIAGYLQYLKDCGGDFHQLIETDRRWYWEHREVSDQAWGENAMHLSLRTDLFGYATDQELELAGRLQERNYVSLYPRVVSGEEENQVYYAVWAAEAVVNWSGDEGQLLTVVERDKIKHGPVVRLLLTDEFNGEQSNWSSENLRYIALAAYVDYLHKTDQYQQYLQYRSQASLLKEYPFLSKQKALTDPDSDHSLYCIIQGGDHDAREKIIKEIAEILFEQGKINAPEPVEYTFKELAQILYGADIVDAKVGDKDKVLTGFKNPKDLEKGKLYVLTKPELCDISSASAYSKMSYSGWEWHVSGYLEHYQPGRYYIVVCQTGNYSAEEFIRLRPQYEFMFKDAIIVVEKKDPEVLYQEYTENLNKELKKQLPDAAHEADFVQYVKDNHRALGMSDRALVKYLADYANFEGKLTLPEDAPYTLSNMKEAVIGKGSIWKIMDQLHAYADFLERAEQEDMNIPPYYRNMFFVGNVGTGKTLMANYVTRLLWQYGLVKSPNIVAVDFHELQLAPDTIHKRDYKDDGIVLVIEDVCNKGDERNFVEALGLIVKHMDDYMGKQIIILTGTPGGIEQARKACANLSTRVNHVFHFEDYSAAEMTQMFFFKMKEAGFECFGEEEKELNQEVQDLCDNFGHRRNIGNGRFVDQLVDLTIMNHAQRVPDEESTRIFSSRDIPTERDLGSEPVDYEHMLDSFVGMKVVKDKVKEVGTYIQQQKRVQNLAEENKENIKIRPLCMHMVFTGNPGTGKTSVARKMADMLYSMGVLKTDHFTEVGREGLVGEYIGQTALKTEAVVEEALDGVLFVDEAYTLAGDHTDKRDFGKEAIATLLRAMEDYKDCLVIIFAGYTDEMRKFFESNPGISSRIAYTIDFPDYTPKELTEIFRRKMTDDGYTVKNTPGNKVLDKVENLCEHFVHRKNFGNGRFVDKLMQETRIRHANNAALLKTDDTDKNTLEEFMTLTEDDIPSVQVMAGDEEPEGRTDSLDDVIGLQKVKEDFDNFEKVVEYQNAAKEHGVTIPDFHMHMVFKGDPGTGKTMIARRVKDELYQIGMIKENKLVEVEGKDLIAEYVGQTQPKTEDVIDSAMGGVLFIDEAYSLAYGSDHNSFGKEAVSVLVKAMEDHKDDLVIIFAGYANEMDNFLSMNPGLSSRIGFTFTFENYSVNELTEMFAQKMGKNGYGFEVTPEAKKRAAEVIEYFIDLDGFGNGRFVDRLIQMTITKRAKRFGLGKSPEDAGELKQIKKEDIASELDMGARLPDSEEEEKAHRVRVACHEAGHALVEKALEPNKILHKITVRQNAVAEGYVERAIHLSDRTESALKDQLASDFGGRNAEDLIFGEHDSGCRDDMQQANQLAQAMVDDYAMGSYGKTTPMDLLQEADQTATDILTKHEDELRQIQEFLLEKGTVTGEEFETFYQGIHKETAN